MKKGCYAGALVLLLGGCGGSDEASSGDSGAGSTAARLVMDVQSVAYMCDVTEAKAGADILVHRQDGSILSAYKSDAKGHVDVPWPSEAAHLTVAVQEFYNDQSTWSIRTDLVAKAGDYGVYRFTDANLNSRCDCNEVNFDVSEIEAVYGDYQLYVDSVTLGTQFGRTSLRMCKQGNKFAPVNMVLVPKQTGVAAYTGSIDLNGFDVSQVVPLSSNAFEGANRVGTLLNVDVNTNDYSLGSYSETEYGLQNLIGWPMNAVQLFPALFDRNLVLATRGVELAGNELGSTYYRALTRRAVTDTSKNLSLNLPLNENQMLEETTRLLAAMNTAGSVSYDFSFSAAHMQVASISIGDFDHVKWMISGPLQGTIPDLDLPAHLQAAFDGITAPGISLQVWGYEGMADLYDWRAEFSKASRSTAKMRSTKFDNYNRELIDITVY